MSPKHALTLATLSVLLNVAAPVYAQPQAGPLRPSIAALNHMQIYAAQALANTEEARAALNDGDNARLTSDLGKTRLLLELIRARMPAAEFHAMLRAVRAVMQFQDNQQVLPLFPKLFYALDDLPSGHGVDRARADLKQAENDLQKPDRADALQALNRADGEFTDPVLTPPLNAAEHDLRQAVSALGGGSLSDATLAKLATELLKLHLALATYPLDMQPTGPVTQD